MWQRAVAADGLVHRLPSPARNSMSGRARRYFASTTSRRPISIEARPTAGRGVSDPEAHELLDMSSVNGDAGCESRFGIRGATDSRHEIGESETFVKIKSQTPNRVTTNVLADARGTGRATRRFQERLYNEFPPRSKPIADPVQRRTFLKLMGASMALAGVTACTRQPVEKIVPYVRQPEELRPRQAAVLRDRDDRSAAWPRVFSSRATRAGRRRSRATRSIPAVSGAADVFAQAAHSRPLRSRSRDDADAISARSARGRRFSARCARALTAQQPLGGARAPDPHRIGRLADARGADSRRPRRASRQAKWHQWDPASRDNARAGSTLAFGEYVDHAVPGRPRRRHPRARRRTSSAAAPAASATPAISPSRRRPETGAARMKPGCTRSRSMPTPTGLASRPPARREAERHVRAFAAAVAAAGRRRQVARRSVVLPPQV